MACSAFCEVSKTTDVLETTKPHKGKRMKIKIKSGMGGSLNGKNRYYGTEFLKKISKKGRRAEGKAACK